MDNVTISAVVFSELLRKAERVDAVERLAKTSPVLMASDVLAILGIEKEKNYV